MKSTRRKAVKKDTNVWDFLIHVCDKIYNLLKFGHVFSAAILVLLICILVVILKYPPGDLPNLVDQLFLFLGKQWFYIIPMSIVLGFSLTGNLYQYRTYTREIRRLCNLRKKLIHGLEDSTLIPMNDHHSSTISAEVLDGTN